MVTVPDEPQRMGAGLEPVVAEKRVAALRGPGGGIDGGAKLAVDEDVGELGELGREPEIAMDLEMAGPGRVGGQDALVLVADVFADAVEPGLVEPYVLLAGGEGGRACPRRSRGGRGASIELISDTAAAPPGLRVLAADQNPVEAARLGGVVGRFKYE
jgi:hypothetical protein